MRLPFIFRAIPLLISGLFALVVAGRDFSPGDQIFDVESQKYVDWDPARSGEYCEKCEAFHPKGRHEVAETCPRCGTVLGEDGKCPKCDAPPMCPRCGTVLGEDGKCPKCDAPPPDPTWWERFLQFMESHSFLWWGVPAGVLSLVFIVSLLRGRRRFRVEEFPMVNGVPRGTALIPDQLVCAFAGAGDGGTAIGYRARLRDGGRWRHAFVKRMVGRSLRPDQRVPALQFEADILQKLSATEVVPKVFQMPVETTVGDERWNYFVMSEASGVQWPERGGFETERETRRALMALCEALVRIHGCKVGHYDLKPQNIFWDARNRRITLIDFGSAIDHSGEFVNPLSGLKAGTKPWTPPESDGKILADLTPASDAWVFGLILCEALVGGVHDVDRTQRKSPERPDDRQWFKGRLSETCSPGFAETVVEDLLSLQRMTRLTLDEFLTKMREEWE